MAGRSPSKRRWQRPPESSGEAPPATSTRERRPARPPAPAPAAPPPPRPTPPRRPPAPPESRLPQPTAEPSPFAANWTAIARGVALFLGVFSLANLAGELLLDGFDANLWWIDLRPCPVKLARAVVGVAGVLLVLFGLRPDLPSAIRKLAMGMVLALFCGAVYNVVTFYALVRYGAIRTDLPLPFSLHVAACLAVVFSGLTSDGRRAAASLQRSLLTATTTLVCLVGFPLTQMYCFGKTDYRRRAEAIVVFGCQVTQNDAPSFALHDRVRTACELYSEGLADLLVVSGGPGEGKLHETDVMKRLAIEMGVPESKIVVDRDGLDTQSTVRNTAAVLRDRSLTRVLAVSHFYHMPRIKLCYRREGLDVFTVPARQEYKLPAMYYHLTRETAALWYYYFRPLAE